MSILTKDSKLSEPIFLDPTLIPVINRFGITLGVGDLTIEETCQKYQIDCNFFLAVLNTHIDKDYFPDLDQVHLSMVIDYLSMTDLYYSNVQLPNIERHFNLLLAKNTEASLQLLNKFFQEVRDEMQASISNDLELWFPLLKSDRDKAREMLIEAQNDNSNELLLPYGQSGLEDKIKDLISFFVIHLKGDFDKNLCVAVISAIFILEKDIRQTNRIRDRILQPLCIK